MIQLENHLTTLLQQQGGAAPSSPAGLRPAARQAGQLQPVPSPGLRWQ